MTIKELYQNVGGDYDQAMRVLRMEKLMDKHVRKFPQNGVVEGLLEAVDGMDPTRLFEAAHAMKGVCANLGFTGLSSAASDVTEEFRPGNSRSLSDDEVKAKLADINALYAKTIEGIKEYIEG